MFNKVFIQSYGSFLPGPAINNDEMDRFIAPINGHSPRVKRRILAENGIQTRHYAIDPEGNTLMSAASMAGKAIQHALESSDISLAEIDYLACASVGGDLAVPGFANQVQGWLHAPPMQTISVQGICASGVLALNAAAQSIELGHSQRALVAACEFPSRLFHKDRFPTKEKHIDFEAHFLRWMLSDGAGAVVLSSQPEAGKSALQVQWIHSKSFSGDYPTCMKIGSSLKKPDKSYLDYNNLQSVDEDGAFLLRQDIRLLPNLFDLGISEFSELVKSGKVNPQEIDHFLCHYSSEKFSGMIKDLLRQAELEIADEKWFSNLTSAGNTGSASIFIMLEEFMRTKKPKAGEKILCFVPESGRFTVCFMMFEVVGMPKLESKAPEKVNVTSPQVKHSELASTLRELNHIWHNYRSRVFRSRMVTQIYESEFSLSAYKNWMENWIPQVKEGSLWMREAIKNLPNEFDPIKDLIELHANEEQFDFNILYEDYRNAGGDKTLEQLQRNPGGEALNSYMYSQARSNNSYALLGGIFIIEGTGQKVIPTLLPLLRKQLKQSLNSFTFLSYHGENDVEHMRRWMQAMEIIHSLRPSAGEDIIYAAKSVANLYAMQWELVN